MRHVDGGIAIVAVGIIGILDAAAAEKALAEGIRKAMGVGVRPGEEQSMSRRMPHGDRKGVPIGDAEAVVGVQVSVTRILPVDVFICSGIDRRIVVEGSVGSWLIDVKTDRHVGGMVPRAADGHQPAGELMLQSEAVALNGGRP